MFDKKYVRWLLVALAISMIIFAVLCWFVGGQLVAPANRQVGPPPEDLQVESFSLASDSGSTIAGWYCPNQAANATVVLLHPIRGNRKSMLSRARLFINAGFAVAMVDLQGHGESLGEQITIGYLESRDVTATVAYVRSRNPTGRIGVVGCSLGGASTLLAAPIDVDALVLESVYPDITSAVYNRVRMRLGIGSYLVAPALLVQLEPRLGIGTDELRPIDGLAELDCPVLIAAGDKDIHTTVTETRAMFAAASQPKALALFEGAEHEDLLAFDSELYKREVVSFVIEHLLGDGVR